MVTRRRFILAAFTATVFLFLAHVLAPGEALAISAAWTKTYNGAANGDESGNGVAVGADGSVYVVGFTFVPGKGLNLLLRKYAADGTLKWMKTYNGAASGDDVGYGVAVAPNGYVYVTGSTAVAGQGPNLLLQKYSPGGSLKWTRTYDGIVSGEDGGYGVAVGPDGSVAVTGYTDVGGEDFDILLLKYLPDGSPDWTRMYGGGVDSDRGHGVAVDGDGNIYVTGYLYSMGESRNMALLKYSSTGVYIWGKTYNGAADDQDVGFGVAVGTDDSVYVVGESFGLDSSPDLVLWKYATNGVYSWEVAFDDADVGQYSGRGVAVGGDGSVFVTGWMPADGQASNLLLQKYTPGGSLRWTKTYNGAASGGDGGRGVAVKGGAVYVTGMTETGRGDDNLLLRKYR